MRDGASFFCCDFSEEMIKLTREWINSFVKKEDEEIKHVGFDFKENIYVPTEISKYETFKKWIFSFVADNQSLPFENEQFDLYLSVLSLMIVIDYKKQI